MIKPDLRRLGDAPDRFEQITPAEEVILLKAQRAGKDDGHRIRQARFAVAPVDASRGWLTHRWWLRFWPAAAVVTARCAASFAGMPA